MDAQADGRIDLAAYSARAFATVRLMCECVDALATPTGAAGETGQVAVLAGDPARIASLANLGPSKLGRIASHSIASHDMAQGVLMIGGKPVSGNEDFWVDYADYSAAMNAYQNNEIDGFIVPVATSFSNIASAGSTSLNAVFGHQQDTFARPVSALWKSPFWPYGPVAVRTNLATDAKNIVLKTLEQMDVTEPMAHATLSEGLAGDFRKMDTLGYENVSASIRLLVNQSAKWR
jgi:phosphonate transport system substrate-binding protein